MPRRRYYYYNILYFIQFFFEGKFSLQQHTPLILKYYKKKEENIFFFPARSFCVVARPPPMSNGDPGLCASEGVALASVSTFFYYIIGCAAHNAGLSFPSLFSLSSDCGGGAALDNRENNIHLFHLFFCYNNSYICCCPPCWYCAAGQIPVWPFLIYFPTKFLRPARA